MTSATQSVKEELARYRSNRKCCRTAELSALLHLDGTYRISAQQRHSLITESTNALTARKIFILLHGLFRVETSLIRVERSTPRRRNVYSLEITQQPGFHQILNELGVINSSLAPLHSVPARITHNNCCVAACLRGAFLGGGFVSEPYGPADFEISFSKKATALSFQDLFLQKSIDPGLRSRRSQWVLYSKKRRQISEFLAVTRAYRAHLNWESQSIINSTKNEVNRLVNCDAANARRLAEASLRQQETIRKLDSLGLLFEADPTLVEVAEARIQNPQASMAELGKMLDSAVSKAVVQGRFRRLFLLLPTEAGD